MKTKPRKTKLTKKFKDQCLSYIPDREKPVTILPGSWLGLCLLCHEKEVGEIHYHNRWGNEVHKIGVSSCCDGRICEGCEKELKPKRKRVSRFRR